MLCYLLFVSQKFLTTYFHLLIKNIYQDKNKLCYNTT
jgi:hypothetical protein